MMDYNYDSQRLLSVGTVEKIDSYFQKYQMGHYQANAVMPHHTPPPGSTIPVVRTDPQDSGIEDLVDTMPSSSRDRKQQFNKNVLSDQELMVYRHALLCAQFPVLGSRLPTSALSSPSSSVSSPHGGGGRGGASSLLTSPPPSPGSLSLDGGGDEGDSMVQEETLCVLVKEAFGLSEERHLFYDDYINRGLGNKPPAKHLVEELMGRLSLLQTNSHPFYKPQDFETRNAYDLWQQQEGQRISALINRFWKGPLPNLDPLVCRASYWSNMRDMYRDLLLLLLKHDKVLKAGPSTGCPLLSSSRRLLREFHFQYGIGEVFRRAVYLEQLSSKEWFESDDWFLKHMSQSLLGIQDLLTKHQARVTMVRKEYELLRRALTQFQERCCDLLEKLLQERTPQHRVVCLITNLSDILALSAILLGRHQGNLEAIITQSLKESVQNSYNGHKLRLTTELRLNAYSSPVSAELISKLIAHIKSEVQYIQENYQQLFQLYHVEIMESAASTFYSCLMADVSVLCDKVQVAQQEPEQMRESVDPEMVAMARRLDRLDQTWKNYIPATSQQWRKSLTKSAVHWFQYLIQDMQAMIVYSICRDKFEAVHLTFSQDDEGSHNSYSSSGHHRPSNANPLTQSIGSAFASVIPKDQKQRDSERVSNNNNTSRPKATQPQHRDISFNPSGVLNFKGPVRTGSFPQITDLLDRSEQWSAAGNSKNEGVDGPHLPGGGGDAFQPVDSKTRGSSRNSKLSHQELTHSQSFPELSTAAAAPEDIPGPSGVQDTTRTLPPLPHHDFHDDYTSGKDQSTSTSRSRSNSSQHHSDRTYSSDMEASTDASSSSRSRHRAQLRAVFEQLGLFSGEGLRQSEITLPISSSLVDMVYVVRHACSLMYDICSVLKPEMSVEVEADELQQGLLAIDLQQLFISPIQGMTFAIRLFASNMLAMDLCATPSGEVNKMISKEVLNRVFIAQSAGLLGGCRHERSGLPDCNIYFNRDRACLCDNFEPINPEMCLRINNVQGLLELLPDLLTDLDGAVAARLPKVQDGTEGTKKQRPLQRYLHNLIVGQIKLLAFKVNQMLSQALGVLLQLDMGSYSITDRLHPLTASIHNHLVATSSWLYPQCYQVFCQELWKCIVQDFEKLVEELLMLKTEDRLRAMLLLQAIAHLMETIINHSEHGLSPDVFLEPADGVIQVLQLYTWPTSRLIQLYQGLLQKAWEGTTTESWPVRLRTLRILQRLLCQQRKCFTGNELLHALVHCQEEEQPAENIWEWAYQTAEQLLGSGLVRTMTASGNTVDLTALAGKDGSNLHFASHGEISDYEGYSFPEVTLHSIPRTSRKSPALDTNTTTPTEDTEGSSDRVLRRLQMTDRRGGQEMEESDSSDDKSGDDEVQHLFEVSVEVYDSLSPAPVRDEQSVVPSESVSRSRGDLDDGCPDVSPVGTVEPAPLGAECEASSDDHPEAKDVDVAMDESESAMQTTTEHMHPSNEHSEIDGVEDKASAEDNLSCSAGISVRVESKDQAGTSDQDEHKSNGNEGDSDLCYPDQSMQKDNEGAQGGMEASTGEDAMAVPGPEGMQQSEGSEAQTVAPSKTDTQESKTIIGQEQEECLDDKDERVFRVIHDEDDARIVLTFDDVRPIEDLALSQELGPQPSLAVSGSGNDNEDVGHTRVECVEKSRLSGDNGPKSSEPTKSDSLYSKIEEQSRTESSSSGIREPGRRDRGLSTSGAVSMDTEGDRIQVIPPKQPLAPNRPYRSSTFSESSTSDPSDCESRGTPRASSPFLGPWSPRGVVPAFTADSQQLYCFSQVYDSIPKGEEGVRNRSRSHSRNQKPSRGWWRTWTQGSARRWSLPSSRHAGTNRPRISSIRSETSLCS
ncbi:uncharacterized protein LOC100888884 isoform X2 [Strongylocentrotus purpuratus]|uniref:MHD2 domain-containing protein n=2 Tax=Strongylocentrotus purpuratus TaxID=7668 RepID=A0A7M7NUB9_STRPU|nr:uncharacterized protein LOC100888884 isoform X2 [Strongylocentrotus purpuratus]